MKTDKKGSVKVSTQPQDQENVRKTFKDLQRDAVDKENLIGRLGKDSKTLSESKVKKVQMVDKSTQAGESSITADDLTSEEPGLDYWKKLAETRGKSLDESLHEIETLKDNINALQEENKICKEMLDESKHLVEILQEMLNETDNGDN